MKYLIGGLEHGCYFPFHRWDIILPIDFHSIIFQDGDCVIAPPTRYLLTCHPLKLGIEKEDIWTMMPDMIGPWWLIPLLMG